MVIQRTPTKIDKIVSLRIGQHQENAATQIKMDVSDWITVHSTAGFHILFKRPGEVQAQPVLSSLEEGILTWTVQEWETSLIGVGYAEVRAIEAESALVAKSRVIPCSIEESAIEDGEVPPEYSGWVEQVLAAADTIETTQQDYEETVESLEQAIADGIEDIQAEGQTQIAAVHSEGTTQVGAVQAKGTEVLNSIPSDYTELSDDVTSLKSAFDNSLATVDVSGNPVIITDGLVGNTAKNLEISANATKLVHSGENMLPMTLTSGEYQSNITLTVNDDKSFYITKTGTAWGTIQLGTVWLMPGDYNLQEIASVSSSNRSVTVKNVATNTDISRTRYNKNASFTLTELTEVAISFASSQAETNTLIKCALYYGQKSAGYYVPYVKNEAYAVTDGQIDDALELLNGYNFVMSDDGTLSFTYGIGSNQIKAELGTKQSIQDTLAVVVFPGTVWAEVDTANHTLTLPSDTSILANDRSGNNYRYNFASAQEISLVASGGATSMKIVFSKTNLAFSVIRWDAKVPDDCLLIAYYNSTGTGNLVISCRYKINGTPYSVEYSAANKNVLSAISPPQAQPYISVETVSGSPSGVNVIFPADTSIFSPLDGTRYATTAAQTVFCQNTIATLWKIYFNPTTSAFTAIRYSATIPAGCILVATLRTIPPAITITCPYKIDGVGGVNDFKTELQRDFYSTNYHVANTSLSSALSRFTALFSGDSVNNIDAVEDCEPFLFFTDPHTQYTPWSGPYPRYLLQIQKAFRSAPCKFVLCGGDWLGNSDTPAEASRKMGLIGANCRDMLSPCYLLVGNHDTNYQGKKDSESANFTTRLPNASISNLWYMGKNAYYTFEGEHTKFYCFDTGIESQTLTADSNYGMTQCEWFAESLQTDNSNHIAVAMHIYYSNYENATWNAIAHQVMQIAGAYNRRATITINGTIYNYASAIGFVEFAIAGHTHHDLVYRFTEDGADIPVVITEDTGKQNSYPSDATFDLVFVDYDNRKIECVRVGDGSDREILLASRS